MKNVRIDSKDGKLLRNQPWVCGGPPHPTPHPPFDKFCPRLCLGQKLKFFLHLSTHKSHIWVLYGQVLFPLLPLRLLQAPDFPGIKVKISTLLKQNRRVNKGEIKFKDQKEQTNKQIQPTLAVLARTAPRGSSHRFRQN